MENTSAKSNNKAAWQAQAQPVSSSPVTPKSEDWVAAWAKEVLTEQRKARRGRLAGIIIRSLVTLAIFSFIFTSSKSLFSAKEITATGKPHLGMVSVQGVIAADSKANAQDVLKAAEQAFKAKNSVAVVLRINSPGGSPVQAGQIYQGLRDLQVSYPEKPFYAVIEDLGASGGYYLAVAAPTILADPSSLVGSIGVVAGGFGFTKAIEKLGIERRVYTAGDNKAFLDPFSQPSKEQEDFWQGILNSTHQQFIARVKESRGAKLSNNPQLFSGLVWNGELALEEGLIDELGSLYSLQKHLGLSQVVDYSPEPNPLQLLEKHLGSLAQNLLIKLSQTNY